jgi:L-2-hydroxyglutarate oxidase LhgO
MFVGRRFAARLGGAIGAAGVAALLSDRAADVAHSGATPPPAVVKHLTTRDPSAVGNKNKPFYSAAAANRKVLSPLAMETDFDIVIVGGGIIGLATARELLARYPGLTVAVLEKEREVAPHQTGHNSGVIHAGMYYEPGSVMAKTCVRGAALMYKYCEDKKLPHERVGKLIVASNAEEHAKVQLLYERGTANGVQGLEVLDGEQVRAMEPNVAAYSALWSPNTGITDYGLVSRSLACDVLETGRADVKLSFQVESFERVEVVEATAATSGGADATAASAVVVVRGVEPGQPGPSKAVTAKHVITCAGFHSDRVARLAGGGPDPKVVTFRGSYYQMKPQWKDVVRTNVYPVPSGGGIPVGVHFTPTVNERRGHQMIIGPGACIAFSREGYKMGQVCASGRLRVVGARAARAACRPCCRTWCLRCRPPSLPHVRQKQHVPASTWFVLSARRRRRR